MWILPVDTDTVNKVKLLEWLEKSVTVKRWRAVEVPLQESLEPGNRDAML